MVDKLKTRMAVALLVVGVLALVQGCRRTIIDASDRSVYALIEQRQKDALGENSDVYVGNEDGRIAHSGQMYEYVPSRVDSTLPEEFRSKPLTKDPMTPEAAQDKPKDWSNATDDPPVSKAPDSVKSMSLEQPTETVVQPSEKKVETEVPSKSESPSGGINDLDELFAGDPDEMLAQSDRIFSDEELTDVTVMGLSNVLAYANARARELQEAKEDLYLAALDLTLERHLWTPQWVGSIQSEYANYGQVRDFDQAMSAVARASVSQRLPYGGEVSAQIVNTLMRDLGRHITSGETGQFILTANLPLLRGAGRVALESRYSAERDLIYAVRSYERFRRSFLVNIAADYFNLQSAKANITNAYKSYESRHDNFKRALAFRQAQGKRYTDVLEAPRAYSSFLDAEATLVSAKENYATLLDRFKIRLGMAVEELIDVVDQDEDKESASIENLLVDVVEEMATQVAVRARLDLLNSNDRVDDARRGVFVTKNRILPDLDITGSASMATNPNESDSLSYNTERATWRGSIELRIDDRMNERNDYRASLINVRRAERRYNELVDNVRLDVRRALRRIAQQENLKTIRAIDVLNNEKRFESATARFREGLITNRDAIEAENDLLRARDQYAGAVASYRQAILEFRRDTGTLRVDENGRWTTEFIPPIEDANDDD